MLSISSFNDHEAEYSRGITTNCEKKIEMLGRDEDSFQGYSSLYSLFRIILTSCSTA